MAVESDSEDDESKAPDAGAGQDQDSEDWGVADDDLLAAPPASTWAADPSAACPWTTSW